MTKMKPSFFIRNVPPELKSKFKIYCLRREITMTDQIIDMVRELLRKDEYHRRNS